MTVVAERPVSLKSFALGEITMEFLKFAMIATLFAAAPTWAQSPTGPQKNAVRSAKQYLMMEGFSRYGLIQQLSSSAGDGYTVNQATYGARQAGACQ